MISFSVIVRVIGALALIIGSLMIGFYTIKRFTPPWTKSKQGPIKLISMKMILPKKYICIVKVEDKTMVLGASEQGLSLLTTLDDRTADMPEYSDNNSGREG